jgi:DNA-binding transcriptional MerR regulator
MRELAEAAGVPAGTIKHYLREGLLRGTWPGIRVSSSSECS